MVPPPITGLFRVYSVENPADFTAYTIDHLNARFPAAPNAHPVQAPNHKIECGKLTSTCEKEKEGYRYTYTISSEVGEIWQGILFLQPEVKIGSIELSENTWSTFRVGFDHPTDQERADGKPTKDEKGILYFGSWEYPVQRDCGLAAVSVSFFSDCGPGYVLGLTNKFHQPVLGPVFQRSC